MSLKVLAKLLELEARLESLEEAITADIPEAKARDAKAQQKAIDQKTLRLNG